jgi:hypothetical protein
LELVLNRFVNRISKDDLLRALDQPNSFDQEILGMVPIDLTEFETIRMKLLDSVPQRSKWDSALVEPFHRALSRLTEAEALDMRFWHWICIAGLPEYVKHRWVPKLSDETSLPERVLAHHDRFLGGANLRGIAHNTCARLWWAGHTLFDDTNGYKLARKVLESQDLFTSLFERELVLHRPFARACVIELGDLPGDRVKQVLKRTNQWATTMVFDTMDEERLQGLIREALE